MIEIDRYDSESYGAFGVNFDSLTPQQQEVIIDYCTDNIDEDYKRADDSATYWKDNFENLYNDIVNVVTVDGEEMTDGECVDALFNVLKKYRGESDQQAEVKF